MLKRINAVNVCGAIAFLALFAVAGFAEGGNYIMAVVSLIVFAAFAFIAQIEDGKENRPR